MLNISSFSFTTHVKIALLDSGLSKKYSVAIIISSGKSIDAQTDVMLKVVLSKIDRNIQKSSDVLYMLIKKR